MCRQTATGSDIRGRLGCGRKDRISERSCGGRCGQEGSGVGGM